MLARKDVFAARQWGRTQHSNAVLCQYAAQSGGLPKLAVVVQISGVYVIWEPTGEVRTLEQKPCG